MSTLPPGLEKLVFEFRGSMSAGHFDPILVGVVGSGNLEVLFEPTPGSSCRFHVETSARGFRSIWEAVFRDFHRRNPYAGLQVSINDMGATPAVVGLRLQQAAAELPKGHS
jgi:malonate decarboxylase delta subunit